MSPTESQLRAALQEGAGRGVDADAIIARAERYRRARRQRITNIVAAAAVACVFVGGGTWFAVSNSDNEQSGSTSGGVAAAPYASHAAPRRRETAVPAPRPAPSSAAAGNGTSATVAACARNARRIPVPAAAPTGDRAELFPGRASAITACGYVTDSRVRHRAVLHGAVAQRVATTLDNGSTTPVESDRGCPVGSNRGPRILLFAVGANGARAKPVQVTVRCANVVATNGHTARYLPTLPDPLSALVR